MILLAGQSNLLNMATGFAMSPAPVVVAQGGSSIRDWLPGGQLFETIRPLLPQAHILVFWQGETEAITGGHDAASWDILFAEMVRQIKKVNPAMRIIFGQSPNIRAPYAWEVRGSQRMYGLLGSVAYVPCPLDLPLSDDHHVAPAALNSHGLRFLEAIRDIEARIPA